MYKIIRYNIVYKRLLAWTRNRPIYSTRGCLTSTSGVRDQIIREGGGVGSKVIGWIQAEAQAGIRIQIIREGGGVSSKFIG